MIRSRIHPSLGTGYIDILPNPPLSRRQLIVVLALLALMPMLLAVYLTLLGAWPVLPFAGIEIIAVASGLFYSAQRGRQRQRIYLTRRKWIIERRSQAPFVLHRAWVKLHIEAARTPFCLPRLWVGIGNRWIEVGDAVGATERKQLHHQLYRLL